MVALHGIDTRTDVAPLLGEAGRDVDWSHLDHVLSLSAAPDTVLGHLREMAKQMPEETGEVLSADVGLVALTTIVAVSQSLTRWLLAHPIELRSLSSQLTMAPLPNCSHLRDLMYRDLAATSAHGEAADALRRFRTGTFLRIALRDLLHVATLEETGRCLADLADACMDGALSIARMAVSGRPPTHPLGPEVPAVIGMGKLGGRELNYSSDIDVIFVSGDSKAVEEHTKIARRFMGIMSDPSPEGIVWRVDADLRPEGRSGHIVRSLEGYLTYYGRWADQWEFQALIKRRSCAGDLELGERFVEETDPYVWPSKLSADAVEELRAMKAKAETQVSKAGLAEREVKLGPGGIRDVEFAVQLLQVVHGRHDSEIRSPNTIQALGQLATHGYIDARDQEILANSYVKLRTVEHRLQLENERQVHALPTSEANLDRLARVLEYRPGPDATASEKFLGAFREDLATVRSVHERLFYRPLLEAFAGEGPMQTADVKERLRAFGFADTAATPRLLESLTSGLSRRSKLMEATLPLLLGWLSDAPNPDLGLLLLERLASRPHLADTIVSVFRDSPLAAQRLCTVCGSSRSIGENLARFPELIRLLEDDDLLASSRSHADLQAGAYRQLAWRRGQAMRLRGLRRFVRRERTRIAMRDVLGFTETTEVATELTALAEACLDAALQTAIAAVGGDVPPIAVIGMGRLGGRELSYPSDLDVVIVHGDDSGEKTVEVQRVVAALVETVATPTSDGIAFDLDLDLRPEGKSGILARSVRGYVRYWERWADTWEFQSLLRARPVAGDAALAAEFLDTAEPFVYATPFPKSRLVDVRKMKARVEKERMPRSESGELHVKLSRGGLFDIEFAVQLLQLMHGGTEPSIRTPSTVQAIDALAEASLLDEADATRLRESYLFLNDLRNAMYVLGVSKPDVLPGDAHVLAKIARMLGITRDPASTLRSDFRRYTRRARTVTESILYPDD